MTSASFEGLPGILAEIAEAAGLEAAIRMAEVKGGRSVYIPAKVSDRHWLAVALGREAADKVCRHFSVNGGGVRLLIPLGPAATMKAARRRLAKALEEGATTTEAVSRSGLHERTVYRARARRRDDSQGRLF
ncbi:MAG TPA: helix-turn-helix domain-containing protein [Hyphomicrobiales bacterium]|nr:helix-turn-helix domain-containing protein [Kaistiaceae bacterium]HQF30440.1 helix-turn-helix domain-containing protein [Hyphomicrobiales bacterium]